MKDMGLLNDANELITPIGNFNILNDPCQLNPDWDFGTNQIIHPSIPFMDMIDCTITAEICYEHPICPNVSIPCQQVEIHYTSDFILSPVPMTSEKGIENILSQNEDLKGDHKFRVYPNPSNGGITIDLPNGVHHLEILDMQNRKIISMDNVDTQFETHLASGVYIIKIYSAQHKTWSLDCLLYTSPSPRDQRGSRMPSSA